MNNYKIVFYSPSEFFRFPITIHTKSIVSAAKLARKMAENPNGMYGVYGCEILSITKM